MTTAIIFTDGAAKGNPGPGGYGVVLVLGDTVRELGEGRVLTTNNEMELQAVVAALGALGDGVKAATVYTDSKYVVEGATGWVFGWMRNGWKTKTGGDVLHQAIWQELVSLLKKVEVNWQKVPGHVGIIGNERADTIASDFGMGKTVTLYAGSKAAYGYDVDNVSYDKEKAVERSKARERQSAKAHSYVSLVDGVVETHETWTACEARVKGKKGVRFKKALSKAEEADIIADFTKP